MLGCKLKLYGKKILAWKFISRKVHLHVRLVQTFTQKTGKVYKHQPSPIHAICKFFKKPQVCLEVLYCSLVNGLLFVLQ